MASLVTKLICMACGSEYAPDEVAMTCPACGPDEGILDIQFDLEKVQAAWRTCPLAQRPLSQWRYRELLPLDEKSIREDWSVGWTPIIDAQRLASEVGVAQFFVKDDGRNPTASFKDRASSVGVAHALEHQATTIACASTGNAATSLAGHAALAGLPAVIFVPATAPEPKLAQLLVFGATVMAVEGSYDDAYRLCSQACEKFAWYNRNCAINPILVDGKKTAGLEIAEQCQNLGGVPDWIAVSVGDGCTIAGIWKGLKEMHQLGQIDRLPRMLGVQASEVAPIHYALAHGQLPAPNRQTTIADSINVQVPRNWRKAVRALRDSGGVMVCVSDEQILAAMRLVGRHGIFAEPAAAAAIAGATSAVDSEIVGSGDRVLAVITGSGLKDTKSAIQAGGKPIRIEPNMNSLIAALDDRPL